MAGEAKLLLISLLAMTFLTTNSQNYFTYEDCDRSCRALNISCLISKESDGFLNRCTKSMDACGMQANSDTVCMRPNLPPVGGEIEWPEYKRLYHPYKPQDADGSKLLHLALSGAALLLGLFTFV